MHHAEDTSAWDSLDQVTGTLVASVQAHFIAAIKLATVRIEPFAHMAVDNVLPNDVFELLSSDLPSFDSLLLMSKAGMSSVARYERRAMRPVAELSDRRHPAVWRAVARALDSAEVETTIVHMFAPWFDECMRTSLARPLRREVRVHCDLAGSHLTPHTDAPSMFVTSFIYLQGGSQHPSLDTVLYEPLDPEGRNRLLDGVEYAHEDPSWHRRVGRVEFRPNRMFSFLRTSNSLHGLEAITEEAAPRYSLSLHLKYFKGK